MKGIQIERKKLKLPLQIILKDMIIYTDNQWNLQQKQIIEIMSFSKVARSKVNILYKELHFYKLVMDYQKFKF